MPPASKPNKRRPVRVSFALAGAGSLGTFVAGALQEIGLAIRQHNAAFAEAAPDSDSRYMHAHWGRLVIDAIGGSSAGAICGCQVVKSIFEPAYLGEGQAVDAPGTMSGDWIEGADFEALSVEGNTPLRQGRVESPGWTLLSGAKLFALTESLLRSDGYDPADVHDPASPLDPYGAIAIGITLTDLLGYHEYADFEDDTVLGHPEFGAVPVSDAHYVGYHGRRVRDLGVRTHAEIRKLFVCSDPAAAATVDRFLEATKRRGRARAIEWSEATERLASLATASASLPLALGPVALTDQAVAVEGTYRRLYMDGGVLNNKPIAPTLRLSRWQDEVRLASILPEDDTGCPPEAIEGALDYERVCFFVDAFPDRTRGEWRSPHPEDAMRGEGGQYFTEEARQARSERIDAALDTPVHGLGAFFSATLTSLRAQDIRGIAETNYRVARRAEYIETLIRDGRFEDREFSLTTIARANAYGAVRATDAGRELDCADALAVARHVWESDQFSGLSGRKKVTMVPVFAPENLIAVLAGEALYAVGGLLSKDARRHDATVGTYIASSVVQAIKDPDNPSPNLLKEAPEAVLPNDTEVLVKRLKVAAAAAIDGRSPRSSTLKALAKAPLRINPLARLIKDRLDAIVRGEPDDEDG